ncbi:MAG: hypothetical protein F4X52_08890 [Acidimicrobiaceae bacterium]|nr:hypothetical protein [Acidimicrobiaceae bacterium]
MTHPGDDSLGSGAEVASASTGDSRGSDPGVVGGSESDRGSDAEVIGDNRVASDSNALDLVDEALEALDQDDLELAEELADQLQDRPSDEG